MLKKMVLYSPTISNVGGYIDAGTTVEIGTDDEQVHPDRAQGMLDGARAVSVTEDAANTKVASVETPTEEAPAE